MTLPKVVICGELTMPGVPPQSDECHSTSAGDIVWAHQEVQEMLGPLAQIVVCSMI